MIEAEFLLTISTHNQADKRGDQLGDFKLMQYQILQIETMSILWQTVGRIVNEILGVKVLLFLLLSSRCSVMITIVLIGFSDYFGFASLHSIGELCE